VKVTGQKIKVFAAQLLICVLLGAVFFVLEEIFQSWLATSRFACCDRCSNYLYDRSQPVLALCASVACLFYLRKTMLVVSRIRYLLSTIIFSWISFLGYFLFMGISIFYRTECTALYSPGPGFMHSLVIGGPIVGIVLLIETTLWALSCMILLLVLGGIVKSVWRADSINVQPTQFLR
jgi:hypothetical protein